MSKFAGATLVKAAKEKKEKAKSDCECQGCGLWATVFQPIAIEQISDLGDRHDP